MKNITEPYPGIFQVRIRRGGIYFNKTFSSSQFSSKNEALSSATTYRDSIIDEQGKVTRFGQKSRENKTTGIHGIFIKIKKSPGYPHNRYLVFVAHFRNSHNKPENKEFSAGNVEKLDGIKVIKAFNSCRIFRAEYEESVRTGTTFPANRFRDWRRWNKAKIAKEMSRFSLEEINVTSSLLERWIRFD